MTDDFQHDKHALQCPNKPIEDKCTSVYSAALDSRLLMQGKLSLDSRVLMQGDFR